MDGVTWCQTKVETFQFIASLNGKLWQKVEEKTSKSRENFRFLNESFVSGMLALWICYIIVSLGRDAFHEF